MPTRREENKLKGLLEELKAFESSSKNLQSADGLSLLDVRDIFDALIAEHPGVLDYLGSDAAIVQQPEFEDVLLEDKKLGFADRVLKKRKLLRASTLS
ncbi:hypothetical protein PR003_g12207 [Phytophthora rubi]|uniref:Uncharacterized protein n=1 Tax=Phytophthora rubi TaxID=129364 RepID=A0A6A4FL06_9STRA|nr:hypothetical protein PR003_g12207 [Phytophthora rubi]